jgi:hypothetical protein
MQVQPDLTSGNARAHNGTLEAQAARRRWGQNETERPYA